MNVSDRGADGAAVIGAPDANNSSYDSPEPCVMVSAIRCNSSNSVKEGIAAAGVLYSDSVEMIVSHCQYDFEVNILLNSS